MLERERFNELLDSWADLALVAPGIYGRGEVGDERGEKGCYLVEAGLSFFCYRGRNGGFCFSDPTSRFQLDWICVFWGGLVGWLAGTDRCKAKILPCDQWLALLYIYHQQIDKPTSFYSMP